MSPGQEPPKFHLISVPLIKCKPPKSPVTLTNNSTFEDIKFHYPVPGGAPNAVNPCHLSHPTLAMCCDHQGNQLDESFSKEFHPEYFNTIPLKSTIQRACALAAHESFQSYKETPPCSELSTELFYHNNHMVTTQQRKCSALEEPICPIVLQQDPKFPRQSNHSSEDNRAHLNEATLSGPPKLNGIKYHCDLEAQNGESNHLDDGRTMLNDLDRLLDELFGRKKKLLEKLSEEEQNLQQLNQQEMELTGSCSIPNGLPTTMQNEHTHASLSDLSSHGFRASSISGATTCLMPPFKWRNSRRSKSAHDRAPESASPPRYPVYRYSAGNNPFCPPPNSGETVPNGNVPEETNPATMPKRLLKWWRQNRRRTAVDDRRRQSTSFVGLLDRSSPNRANQTLRARGSSMPPVDRQQPAHSESNDGKTVRQYIQPPPHPTQLRVNSEMPPVCSRQMYQFRPITAPSRYTFVLQQNEAERNCSGSHSCSMDDRYMRIRVVPQNYVASANLPPFPVSSGYTSTNQHTTKAPNSRPAVSGRCTNPSAQVQNGFTQLSTHLGSHQTTPKWTTVKHEAKPLQHYWKVSQSPPPLPPKVSTRVGTDNKEPNTGCTRQYTPHMKANSQSKLVDPSASTNQLHFGVTPVVHVNGGNNTIKKSQMSGYYLHPVDAEMRQTNALQLNQPAVTLSWHPIINPQPMIANKSSQSRFLDGYEFLTEDQLRITRTTAPFAALVGRRKQPGTRTTTNHHLLAPGMWSSLRPQRQDNVAQPCPSDALAAQAMVRTNSQCQSRAGQSTKQMSPFRPIVATNLGYPETTVGLLLPDEQRGGFTVQAHISTPQNYGQLWNVPPGPIRLQEVPDNRKLTNNHRQSWVMPNSESTSNHRTPCNKSFQPLIVTDEFLLNRGSVEDHGRGLHQYPLNYQSMTTRVNLPPWPPKPQS